MTKEKDDLSFGKRYGFEQVEVPFQQNNMNEKLRTELWNAHYIYIQHPIENAKDYMESQYRGINKSLWVHFFINPLDDFPRNNSDFKKLIKNHFLYGTRYKVYHFLEFVFANIHNQQGLFEYSKFEYYVNTKLRQHNSAYILSSNKFLPIINNIEINEIKKTQELSKKYKLSGIQEHLNSAIELLSQKPEPDSRNSIKESISMVEVICRIIEPTQNTLGKALNRLDNNQKINGTLKSGFEKLYAYTNNTNGIRHALMDDQNVSIEDAKFFLVSCSAFTNYLVEKAIKENLLQQT